MRPDREALLKQVLIETSASAGVIRHLKDLIAGGLHGHDELEALVRCAERHLELAAAPNSILMVAKIAEILWPNHDPEHQWDSETIEHVARVLSDAGLRPSKAPKVPSSRSSRPRSTRCPAKRTRSGGR